MPKRIEEKRQPLAVARGPKGRPAPPPPPLEKDDFTGEEHRRFPRAKLEVRFDIWIGPPEARTFQATLSSENLSVSGAFLGSTFFLPLGTELRTSFRLGDEDPVQARAVIAREERPDRQGLGRCGFALRFVEFYEQTEVTLARLFLGAQLATFAQGYLDSRRARSLPNEFERVVDALAAWELMKVTRTEDMWGLKRTEE